MAFCNNCGQQITSGTRYCVYCGAEQPPADPAKQDPYVPDPQVFFTPQPPKASGELNVLHLVWAILNLISCCQPLGIVSLFLVILAKDAPTEAEEKKKLRLAKIFNIIGTLMPLLFLFVYIIILFIVLALGLGAI